VTEDRRAGGPALGARVAVIVLAALAAVQLRRVCGVHATFPLWDEAAHGFAGIEVADALRHFNPIELFLALNRQSVWPFVHSLMLAPFFLVGGPGFGSAELVSVLLYAATVVLLFFAGRALHPTRGTWVGLAAAALALVAPKWRVFATLVMLEMPGGFLLVLAFLLHARTLREPASRRSLLAAGAAAAALFFCKYNYGLLWIVPMAWLEWRRLPDDFRARAAAAGRARMTRAWWLRPVPALLAIGGLVALGIALTGGGEWTLFREHVSMRSPGNLAYALFLIALVWVLVPRRGRGSRLAWLRARLPERIRLLAGPIAIPIAIWFVLPGHLREFLGFLANREDGPPPWAPGALVFYPRAFCFDYAATPGLGVVVLVLAVLAFATLPGKRAPGERALRSPEDLAAGFALFAAVLGLFVVELHRYRESRFLFTVAPLLWLCAARTAVVAVDAGLRRVSFRPLRESVWAGLALGVLFCAWIGAPFDSDVLEARDAFRGPASLRPALNTILDGIAPRLAAPDYRLVDFAGANATPAAIEPVPAPGLDREYPPRVVLLGSSNVLSPGLIAWWARIARPEIPRRALPKRAPYLAPGAEDVAIDTRARWVGGNADVVIAAFAAVLPRPLVGEYRNEVWADRETAARLAESSEWSRVSDTRAGTWRVTVFERVH